MKRTLRMTEALHARPANLLVRLTTTLKADLTLRKGGCSADAKNILEVLALGAGRGDELELEALGEDAEHALHAVETLVARRFDADLVPEVGRPHAPGVGVGRAILVRAALPDEATPGPPELETERLRAAIQEVHADITALVQGLGATEAALFEPELALVTSLGPRLLEQAATGQRAESAVRFATEGATTDLLLDVRARLEEALAGAGAALHIPTDEEVIVVTELLTPSLVAKVPSNVSAIVVAEDEAAPEGFTSHAAILARGRGVALAAVPSHVVAAVTDGDLVGVDATASPARVWISPSEAFIAELKSRGRSLAEERSIRAERARAPLAHLGVAVRINVSSLSDAVPPGAEGVGLLRTELLFAGRRGAPEGAEQLAVVLAVARKIGGAPLVVRLFDAGGDKPLPWLGPPADAAQARGMELLQYHPALLATQVRALCKAAESADVRVLLPLARSEGDVRAVRALCPASVPVGAMIETDEAAVHAEAIAQASDFVCVGTNDLASSLHGVSRASVEPGLDGPLLAVVRRVVDAAKRCGKLVTVCGEIAGDERGAAILVGLGVDALSVAPFRFAAVKLALASKTRAECEQAARQALEVSSIA